MAKKEEVITAEIPTEIHIGNLNELPLNSIADYRAYNIHARKLKRPIKIPPSSMYKQVKCKFARFDQPQNLLKFWVRNADIDYKGQIKPGRTYTLPAPVVKFLNGLATPIFAEVKVDDGGETITETKQVGEQPRFSCQVIDEFEE